MFIHAVPDNKGKKGGYYCALVESHRNNGKSVHSIKLSFGFIPSERLPYLKAAFNDGDPVEIFNKERRRLEDKHTTDDVGVKHQKDTREKGGDKSAKNVENTVAGSWPACITPLQ